MHSPFNQECSLNSLFRTHVDKQSMLDRMDLLDSLTVMWNGDNIFLSDVHRLPYGKTADNMACAISIPKRP